MPDRIVTNTSCLIALESVQKMSVLDNLYRKVFIPEAVKQEFGSIELESKEVIRVSYPLVNLFRVDLNLGKGESEVIAFAHEKQLPVIIDDQKARGVAKDIGVSVTGTIGILMKAEDFGMIDSTFEVVSSLKEHGFYVSQEILRELN